MMVSPASSSASVIAPNAGGPVAHKFLVSTVGVKNTLQDEEDIHGAPQPVALARMNRMRQNPTSAHASGRMITVIEGRAAFSRWQFSSVRGVGIAETS